MVEYSGKRLPKAARRKKEGTPALSHSCCLPKQRGEERAEKVGRGGTGEKGVPLVGVGVPVRSSRRRTFVGVEWH